MEHVRVLGDQADARVQRVEGDVAHVETIDPHRAAEHVVEAGDEVGDGRLARAGGCLLYTSLIEDRLALDLAGEPGVALMAQLTATTPIEALEGLGLAFAIRARFVEDMVARSLGAGVAQYVILGAGLDTFALRRRGLVEKLRVFEVDRAPAQEWNRTRLAELRIPVPHGLTFVPADLEADALEEGLLRAGFTSRSPALVSWIAVTQYLSLRCV